MNKINNKISAEVAYKIFSLSARFSFVVHQLFVADVRFENFTSSPRQYFNQDHSLLFLASYYVNIIDNKNGISTNPSVKINA